MDMIAQNYIGCDVSKATLDFFSEATRRWTRIANDEVAIAAFAAGLDPARDFVVLEATGVYDRLLRHGLAGAGIAFSRRNPEHTHSYSRSGPGRAKTDRLDARMLADYGRSHQPQPDPPPSEQAERFQSLVRRRDTLVELRAIQIKQRKQAFDADVICDIDSLTGDLERRIAAIERLIKTAIAEAEEIAARYKLLVSAPGVSMVTAVSLIAMLPELGQRSPKTIAALAGVAPITSESGKSKHKSRIRGGRDRVRNALYMAALSACRHPRFNDAYKAIAARSASKKLAIIAIARKLLVCLNAMIRDQNAFA